jgi:thioredoxin-dependent peroxiredoxin
MHGFSLTLVLMLSFLGLTREAGALVVGDAAPRVSSRDQNGAEVQLAAVYFYPKAGTPGCTAQACSLRDAFPDFSADGIQIVGVSADTVEAQKKFADAQKLPFILLADTDLLVAKAFGVPTIPVLGVPKRQSFLVKDGKIAWIVQSAQTGDHASEVRQALQSLGSGEKS